MEDRSTLLQENLKRYGKSNRTILCHIPNQLLPDHARHLKPHLHLPYALQPDGTEAIPLGIPTLAV